MLSRNASAKYAKGVLSVAEFRDGLNKFQAGLNDEEVAMLVNDLDSDKSGSIDKEEFTALLIRYANESSI